ncbi:hypothetical protein DN757_13560 [Paenibacillus silvae]|uniref:Uncharacterized protein n=1 Tax=Paenibacillus silvae TaxID=1325358 RepID=A0A2W6NHR1_9BACL|nr:hypothetical protein DN757_13560 [Paenibacillus silvae]
MKLNVTKRQPSLLIIKKMSWIASWQVIQLLLLLMCRHYLNKELEGTYYRGNPIKEEQEET